MRKVSMQCSCQLCRTVHRTAEADNKVYQAVHRFCRYDLPTFMGFGANTPNYVQQLAAGGTLQYL